MREVVGSKPRPDQYSGVEIVKFSEDEMQVPR